MPKIQSSEDTTTRQVTSGGNYALVTPGNYLGVVEKVEPKLYQAKASGKWYYALTPSIVLLNGEETRIDRQDITMGEVLVKKGQTPTVDTAVLYNPDPSKPAVYGDAKFFIGSLGFADLRDFEPEYVQGQVVTVIVNHQDYTDKDGQTRTKNVFGYYKSYTPRGSAVPVTRLQGGFLAVSREVAEAEDLYVHDVTDAEGNVLSYMVFETEEDFLAWDDYRNNISDEITDNL